MDTTRFILVVALCLVLALLWDAWQKDYGTLPSTPYTVTHKTETQKQQEQKTSIAEEAADIPQMTEKTNETKPSTANNNVGNTSELISVHTDLFNIKIDTHGGTLVDAELLKYPVSIDQPDSPVVLLSSDPEHLYIIQGGLLSNKPAPAHDADYTFSKSQYSLHDGLDVLQVPLYWKSDNGLVVKKIYEFYRDKYVIKVRYEVTNGSNETWSGSAYGQLQRVEVKNKSRTTHTYTGAVISSPEKRYEKISFDDIREGKLNRKITNGWAAFIQHYFETALIPGSRDKEYRYYTLYLDKQKTGGEKDRFAIGFTSPVATVSAGGVKTFEQQLYVGPKLQHRMEKLAPGLELTVDYGKLWFLAKPIFWCLEKFHKLTGNWGWSIILVTLMLKLLFYNLSAAGYRSMARMRRVQPKMLTIKERYKNDRTRMNKAMMDLYKQEKINPLGGCFPIAIQIPVFISLYWVLLESVELRQTGFIFWINDLSAPDPYFVLPVVMGVTMFVQQRLNPAPMDPVQQKVMMMLPFIFTVFFAFFPSGLVLYWVVNNILSIAQQWMIARNLERSGLKK